MTSATREARRAPALRAFCHTNGGYVRVCTRTLSTMKIGYFLSSEEWGPRELVAQPSGPRDYRIVPNPGKWIAHRGRAMMMRRAAVRSTRRQP